MKDAATRTATLNRLRRLQGQIGGLIRMVEEDRYCIDILAQTLAAKRALRAVERAVIDDHTEHCIEAAIRSGDPSEQRVKFRELTSLLERARE